ncbi:MAG: carboxypeptidase-like regulatory domain-containing protein [Ignavibacteriales bacterium]|nr:carboxypeptidase-like regulatory domain-containing protein [Ignavibacteriales bacterium]
MSSLKQNISLIVKTVILFSFCLLTYCSDSSPLPTPPLQYPNVLQGQVYNLSHPGPIPIDWIPPPYEAVCTVIAQDITQGISLEVKTDNRGIFRIMAPPGNYYLRVKESYMSSETGPYQLKDGQILEVKAYYDNGMR